MPRFIHRLGAMGLAATTLLAAPAIAADEPAVELLLPAGSQGAVIPYRFAGALGPSGLVIEATPTMLLVRQVAAGSPAALMDVPSPERGRLRLATVNGTAVESLGLSALQTAFNPARGTVTLTFARKGESDAAETLVGPYLVPLSPTAFAERKAHWLADQRRFDEAVAALAARKLDQEPVGAKLKLDALDAGHAGDYDRAMALGAQYLKIEPQDGEARRQFALWRTQAVEDRFAAAERLADVGDYAGAIKALSTVPGEGAWLARKKEREARWRSAIADQAAYRKAKAEEKARLEREAKAAARAKAQAAARRKKRRR